MSGTLDPLTGERKWEFRFRTPPSAGILTTASGLIFTGDPDGNLLALGSRDGDLLWHYQMGATLHGTSPITYMVDGKQHDRRRLDGTGRAPHFSSGGVPNAT